ncbi:hypothetical protein BVY03_04890 [bacterium K02(2017)]|nr:hypothetical protein BVY03_04890 [bacterium K02(2017)]
MFIKSFPVGSFQCNCVILADETSGEAIIIDPGDEAEKIIAEVKANQFDVKYIVHTHAHIDHIAAVDEVSKDLGGKICLHQEDLPLYENVKMQAEFLGFPFEKEKLPTPSFITHNDMLECQNDLKTKVIHTPGHTPGSVCFLLDQFNTNNHQNLLLSGDTLFFSSIGRTDLWGGDQNLLLASIKEKLLTLPADTLVIPGHGPQTTIGNELKNNPFLS